MLTSLAYIFLGGLCMGALCQKLKLPRIIGMLTTGIVLGPYGLHVLDHSMLSISSDLRQMALVIILLKAGISLDLNDLKTVGRPAILLSCLPASFEIFAFLLFAPSLLGISRIEALLMGSVLGAVSPAIVVPRMVQLMESNYGTEKSIPQLVMAGASCDDIFVIVLFTAFIRMAQGENIEIIRFIHLSIAIILGITLGAVMGYALSVFFETAYTHHQCIRNTIKVIIVLGVSFMLMAIETYIQEYIPFSGLLAVMSMACMLKRKSSAFVSKRLAGKFGKLWLAAEVLLFVLLGASVDIRYTMVAGMPAIAMIFLALLFRTIGVWMCLFNTTLNWKERFFCVIAYLPKATVQAAIGSVPLTMGLSCGQIILSIAVLAILITAPLGAAGIDLTYRKLLTKKTIQNPKQTSPS